MSKTNLPMFSSTENGAVAYATTMSSIMDLFVKTVRNCIWNTNMVNLMKKTWNENPELFLKLIYFTRDPRHGKGERDVSYKMVSFLKSHLPLTYKLNIRKIAVDFGRIKDLIKFAGIPTGKTEIQEDYEMRIFADILWQDLTREHPSLACKWAPREGNAEDKYAKQLAHIMFPNDKTSLKRYRTEILRPLSQKCKTTEQYMCANEWDQIKYQQVPAQAMKIYGRLLHSRKTGTFVRHDKERFLEYLSAVKSGKTKINTTGLYPHQLVREILTNEDETIELMWTTMINKLRQDEFPSSSIALVDVSASMRGEPLNVAVALGLTIAELAQGPFHHQFITFTSEPHLHFITGETLHQQVNSIVHTEWEQSTNIEKAFDLILHLQKDNKIDPKYSIQNLFMFTDMQFDMACNDNKVSNKVLFDHIRSKFETDGYAFPKLIFWNLRCSDKNAFPVTIDETGTAYVSGFSAELLKVFMKGIDFNPLSILHEFLSPYEVLIDETERTQKFDILYEDEPECIISDETDKDTEDTEDTKDTED